MRVFLSSFKQKFGYLQSAISTSPIGYALQEWIYPNISSAWRRSTPLGINTLPETSLTLQSEHSPLRQHTLTLTPARSSAHKMDSLHFASIILSPTLSLKTSVAQFLRQTRFVLNVLACAEHLAADIATKRKYFSGLTIWLWQSSKRTAMAHAIKSKQFSKTVSKTSINTALTIRYIDSLSQNTHKLRLTGCNRNL